MNFSHDKKAGRNWTGIAIVVVLHIIVGYGIIQGLGKRMIAKINEAVETKIIEDVKPPPPKEIPPPPPPPEMKAPPPPFIPPVEVNVQQPPPQNNPIAVATTAKPANTDIRPAPPAPPAPPAAKPVVSNVPAVVDFNTCAKPEYPKNSQRNEETGTVVLQFLISQDGAVKESKIQKSSGFRDLDRAAQTALGRCRFKPGIVDGRPQESWTSVQYVWTLD
ncbi:energy transducer TonB [Massilia arenosa]|uniref:Energy transducer TonB n=1 Tax=Zemynaea arenosa TaxID=2561931 RepID=A0A4Y9RWI3_9BURK|nr:energy transducer TonB [Massilia arenosa]TFW13243.1 energy transducer TonB [Massilia arenosa]